MERSEIIRKLADLAPHSHAVLFYTDIRAKREVVFPFLQKGLQNKGVAVYATSHEPLEEVRDAMRRWGINVDEHEADRSLVICDHQSFTTPDGRLNDLKIDQFLKDLVERGGPVKVAADPTLLVKRGMVDEVVRREQVLKRRLELPLTMVCAYEETVTDTRNGEFLIEMLRAHSYAVFPGIAMPLV